TFPLATEPNRAPGGNVQHKYAALGLDRASFFELDPPKRRRQRVRGILGKEQLAGVLREQYKGRGHRGKRYKQAKARSGHFRYHRSSRCAYEDSRSRLRADRRVDVSGEFRLPADEQSTTSPHRRRWRRRRRWWWRT